MAAATYDLKSSIPQTRQQSARRVEYSFDIDFSQINAGAGLAAGESVAVYDLPPGYVHERADTVVITPEGAAGNFDLGTEADPDGFVDGGDANLAAKSHIPLAGTETLVPGSRVDAVTEVRASIAAAQPTLDTAVVRVTLVGYLTDAIA